MPCGLCGELECGVRHGVFQNPHAALSGKPGDAEPAEVL
jgi:hypothetical protein